MEFALSDSLLIPDDHLAETCKYRQAGCCKYVVYFESGKGFYCVKNVNELRQYIESMSHQMIATGDNCKGLCYEKRSKSQGIQEPESTD